MNVMLFPLLLFAFASVVLVGVVVLVIAFAKGFGGLGRRASFNEDSTPPVIDPGSTHDQALWHVLQAHTAAMHSVPDSAPPSCDASPSFCAPCDCSPAPPPCDCSSSSPPSDCSSSSPSGCN